MEMTYIILGISGAPEFFILISLDTQMQYYTLFDSW